MVHIHTIVEMVVMSLILVLSYNLYIGILILINGPYIGLTLIIVMKNTMKLHHKIRTIYQLQAGNLPSPPLDEHTLA